MGVDIHLHVVRDEDIFGQDLYDGRNYEWFSNLQMENATNEAYWHLPSKRGIPDACPAFIKKDYEQDYYGFFYIQVGEFKKWFKEWRPDRDAGWATTYEMWLADHKPNYVPEIKHELTESDIPADMHFIEVENINDCSLWLNSYLIENGIPDDGYIVYYFDC